MTGAELFFAGRFDCLESYRALERALLKRYAEAEAIVQKSCIAFRNPRPFCYVTPSRRGTGITVTFGLDTLLPDPRIAQAVEPYPNRWTHHVDVRYPDEIDDQLLTWLDWAHAFKRRAGRAK